jgi:transposase-like protein
MIEVVDGEASRRALHAGALACPGCGGALRPWGHARRRTVLGPAGARLSRRPDRGRCSGCRSTHVLLPAGLLDHRGYDAGVIGAALLRGAQGLGRRRIAEQLAVPASTVADWLRRFAAVAEPLRVMLIRHIVATDQELTPTVTHADDRADALAALGALAVAIGRRFGGVPPDPWRLLAVITGGRALHPSPAY